MKQKNFQEQYLGANLLLCVTPPLLWVTIIIKPCIPVKQTNTQRQQVGHLALCLKCFHLLWGYEKGFKLQSLLVICSAFTWVIYVKQGQCTYHDQGKFFRCFSKIMLTVYNTFYTIHRKFHTTGLNISEPDSIWAKSKGFYSKINTTDGSCTGLLLDAVQYTLAISPRCVDTSCLVIVV